MATFDFADHFAQSFGAAKQRQLRKALEEKRRQAKLNRLKQRMNNQRDLTKMEIEAQRKAREDRQEFKSMQQFMNNTFKYGQQQRRHEHEKDLIEKRAAAQQGGQSQRDVGQRAGMRVRALASGGESVLPTGLKPKGKKPMSVSDLEEDIEQAERGFKRTAGAVNTLPYVTGDIRSSAEERVREATGRVQQTVGTLEQRLQREIQRRKQRIRAGTTRPKGQPKQGRDLKGRQPAPVEMDQAEQEFVPKLSAEERAQMGVEIQKLKNLRERVQRLNNQLTRNARSVPGEEGRSQMGAFRSRALREYMLNEEGRIKQSRLESLDMDQFTSLLNATD